MTGVDQMYSCNIERCFRSATMEELSAGCLWYRQAHFVARVVAAVGRVSVEQAAGVIAALSPMNRWEDNVADAIALARDARATARTTGVNREKAVRLLAGEPVGAVLSGRKVRAFWQGIVNPFDSREIAVDRHLYRAALDREMWFRDAAPRPEEFGPIEAAYLRAAARLDLPATAVASTVWLVMRRVLASGQRALPWTKTSAAACRHCSSPRLIGHGPRRRLCKDCGKTTTINPRPRGVHVDLPGDWPGPVTRDSRGRLRIFLGKGHPAANTGGWQYVPRFLAWRETGHVLRSDEHCHHTDGDVSGFDLSKIRVVVAEYHGRLHGFATLLYRLRDPLTGRWSAPEPSSPYRIPRYHAILGNAAAVA